MSNVDEVEKIFKAVPAFPNDVMLASLAQECMTIVSHLERQLEEATNKLTRIESVCDGYKAMQSEYETDTEIPYWDIMNIIKEKGE